MKNPLARLAIILFTLTSISAVRDDYPYSWSIGPAVEGKSVTLRISFKKENFPQAYFFARLQGRQNPQFYDPSPADGVIEDGVMTIQHVFSTPSNAGEQVTVIMGIAKVPYYTGLDFNKIHIYIQHTITVYHDPGLLRFQSDCVVESSEDSVIYDPTLNTRNSFTYHDAFYSHGAFDHVSASSRKIPIDEMHLDYINSFDPPRTDVQAELRLLDHKSDYSFFATSHYGYKSIDLAVTVTYRKYGLYRYTFANPNTIQYSAIDFDMALNGSGEPTFLSKDFLLPLRKGHDSDVYRFQIRLVNVGAYGREVFIDSSICCTKKFFGPCDSAEYCIVSGG